MPDGVEVVLFDTAATVDPAVGEIAIPVHAWGYTPQASRARRALVAELFEHRYGLRVTEANRANFDRRVNLLMADNQPDVVVTVTAHAPGGDVIGRVVLPPTQPNGHTRGLLKVPTSSLPVGVRSLELRVAGRQTARGEARLLGTDGLSVICDIDDTVKVSGVTERRALWEATFFEPFKTVDGMPGLLDRIVGPERAVHYVSSSPWHLYGPLREWMRDAGLPVATLELKQIRLKDRSIVNILKSPTETKPPAIAALLKQFPKRRFVLVGDSGEKDPEIYSAVARAQPDRITAILIRLAPGGENGQARFAALAEALPRGLLQTYAAPEEVDFSPMLQSK